MRRTTRVAAIKCNTKLLEISNSNRRRKKLSIAPSIVQPIFLQECSVRLCREEVDMYFKFRDEAAAEVEVQPPINHHNPDVFDYNPSSEMNTPEVSFNQKHLIDKLKKENRIKLVKKKVTRVRKVNKENIASKKLTKNALQRVANAVKLASKTSHDNSPIESQNMRSPLQTIRLNGDSIAFASKVPISSSTPAPVAAVVPKKETPRITRHTRAVKLNLTGGSISVKSVKPKYSKVAKEDSKPIVDEEIEKSVYDYVESSQNSSDNDEAAATAKQETNELKKNKNVVVIPRKQSRPKVLRRSNTSKHWSDKSIKVAMKAIKPHSKSKLDTSILSNFDVLELSAIVFPALQTVQSTPKAPSSLPEEPNTERVSFIPNDSQAENIDPHFAEDDPDSDDAENCYNIENQQQQPYCPVSPSKTYARPKNRQPLHPLPIQQDVSDYFGFREDVSANSTNISGNGAPSPVAVKTKRMDLLDQLRQLRHTKITAAICSQAQKAVPNFNVEVDQKVARRNTGTKRKIVKIAVAEKKKMPVEAVVTPEPQIENVPLPFDDIIDDSVGVVPLQVLQPVPLNSPTKVKQTRKKYHVIKPQFNIHPKAEPEESEELKEFYKEFNSMCDDVDKCQLLIE